MVNPDNKVSKISELCTGIMAVAYSREGWRDVSEDHKDPMVITLF